MSKKTHAEIIDEIRLKCARAYWSEDSLHPNGDIPEIKCLEPHKLATQLESAHKREMDALKQRCAELNAEVAAKDEVIKRLNDAISEEQRRQMATTEKSLVVGDAAKMREVVGDLLYMAKRYVKKTPATQSVIFDAKTKKEIRTINYYDVIAKAQAALAAPARNCDTYENDNAIEQFEREIIGKEAATTYERLENMRENWFRYNRWLFEKAKKRRGDESPRTGQETI